MVTQMNHAISELRHATIYPRLPCSRWHCNNWWVSRAESSLQKKLVIPQAVKLHLTNKTSLAWLKCILSPCDCNLVHRTKQIRTFCNSHIISKAIISASKRSVFNTVTTQWAALSFCVNKILCTFSVWFNAQAGL